MPRCLRRSQGGDAEGDETRGGNQAKSSVRRRSCRCPRGLRPRGPVSPAERDLGGLLTGSPPEVNEEDLVCESTSAETLGLLHRPHWVALDPAGTRVFHDHPPSGWDRRTPSKETPSFRDQNLLSSTSTPDLFPTGDGLVWSRP